MVIPSPSREISLVKARQPVQLRRQTPCRRHVRHLRAVRASPAGGGCPFSEKPFPHGFDTAADRLAVRVVVFLLPQIRRFAQQRLFFRRRPIGQKTRPAGRHDKNLLSVHLPITPVHLPCLSPRLRIVSGPFCATFPQPAPRALCSPSLGIKAIHGDRFPKRKALRQRVLEYASPTTAFGVTAPSGRHVPHPSRRCLPLRRVSTIGGHDQVAVCYGVWVAKSLAIRHTIFCNAPANSMREFFRIITPESSCMS